MACGLLLVACGVWLQLLVACGLELAAGWWLVAYGLWLVACGLLLGACCLWLAACGLWLAACGLLIVTCGLLLLASGLWLGACGLWLVACCLWLVACLWLYLFCLYLGPVMQYTIAIFPRSPRTALSSSCALRSSEVIRSSCAPVIGGYQKQLRGNGTRRARVPGNGALESLES